jgi:hypothetical protein
VLDAESAITIESNGQAVTGGTMARILVTGNRFSAARGDFQALVMWGGLNGAKGNTVSSVWFHNNIVERYAGGVFVLGGYGGARDNRVENVQIANSTFYRTDKPVSVQTNATADDSGNTVAGIDVRNSIFWNNPNKDFWNEMTPDLVSFSITTHPGYTGGNGNFSGDPVLAAPETGDFRLQAGSPAIDRGTAALAPSFDMFCRPRVGPPDLGALEFGSSQSACSTALPGFPVSLGFSMLTTRNLFPSDRGHIR